MSYGSSTVELLGVDGRVWMKADARFWREEAGEGGEQTGALIGDRWLRLAGGDQFREFCDLGRFVERAFSGGLVGADASQLSLGAVSSIDGVEVVAVTEELGPGRAYGYVETGGRHRLVRMVVTGAGSGDISFTDFDEPLEVRAPRPREVADLGPLDGLDGV